MNADEASPPPGSTADALRAWAKGVYPVEAATELLIRTGWAHPSLPWIRESESGGYWIDFPSILSHIGALSGGEKRLLRLIASLGDDTGTALVPLADCVSLDRGRVKLVLAAIAHAAGTHEGPFLVVDPVSGTARLGEPHASLHPWPGTRTSGARP